MVSAVSGLSRDPQMHAFSARNRVIASEKADRRRQGLRRLLGRRRLRPRPPCYGTTHVVGCGLTASELALAPGPTLIVSTTACVAMSTT